MHEQQQDGSNHQPSLDRVTASIESIASEVINLKQELQHQRDETKNLIYAVLVAALLVFLTIGVEVIIFHTR